MNHETRESGELRFVCPECGSHSLWANTQGCLEIDHVYDDSVMTWDRMRPDEISEYYCGECGYVLKFEEDEGLAQWLITHCKQDESDAGKAQEDNSAVPPDNES